jgi:hypothetical protein
MLSCLKVAATDNRARLLNKSMFRKLIRYAASMGWWSFYYFSLTFCWRYVYRWRKKMSRFIVLLKSVFFFTKLLEFSLFSSAKQNDIDQTKLNVYMKLSDLNFSWEKRARRGQVIRYVASVAHIRLKSINFFLLCLWTWRNEKVK